VRLQKVEQGPPGKQIQLQQAQYLLKTIADIYKQRWQVELFFICRTVTSTMA